MNPNAKPAEPPSGQRYMTTCSGRKVYIPHPLRGQITIEDMATHLGRVRRWVGACPRYFSVAQHSLIVADLTIGIDRAYGDSTSVGVLDREALVHDGAEYLTNDVPSPIKSLIGTEFKRLTQSLDAAIRREFRLGPVRPASVYLADKIALMLDAEILMKDNGGTDLIRYVPIEALSVRSKMINRNCGWYKAAVELTHRQMDEKQATEAYLNRWNLSAYSV